MITWMRAAMLAAFSTSALAQTADEVYTPPGREAAVELHSVPNARCSLHAPGDPEQGIEVFSDEQGFITIHTQLDYGQVISDLELECAGEAGAAEQRTIHVRPGFARPMTARKRAMRPPLAGDPMHVSQRELRRQGYPPRPDSNDAEQLRVWLESVSRPHRRISPHRVPTRRFNKQTIVDEKSNNWSAFVLEPTDGARFVKVQGNWVVPAVDLAPGNLLTSHVTNPKQFSSLWVGLDAGPGILQAGTGQDVARVVGLTVRTYYAWIEAYPGPMEVVPDVPVSPGDFMMFRVSGTNRDGDLDPDGEFMGFEIHNHTADEFLFGDVFAKVAEFQGNTAEWVMERTTLVIRGVAQPLRPLPYYGVASITGAVAIDSSGRRHDLFSATDQLRKIVMVAPEINDDALTSAIQRTSSSSMKFTWVNPEPPTLPPLFPPSF